MSKSILQEVATFNAEMFNEAKLKADISGLQNDIQSFYESNTELVHDLQSEYKIIVAGLLEETNTTNEQLKAEMLQLQIDLESLEKFSIAEISKYFYNTGAMRKEYRRNHVRVNDTINHQRLQRLEYYTGEIQEIELDAEQNFVQYSAAIVPEISRLWMYINGRAIKYAGRPLLTLDATGQNITIGDDQYNDLILPGTLTVQNNITVNDGVLDITSPASTDDSITVNGNIISTGGFLKVNLGLETTAGDIKTSSGEIITLGGGVSCTTNIVTSTGDIQALGGSMLANTGYTTNTGGYTCITSGSYTTPIGNFISGNGYVQVTQGLTSTGGNIEITGATAGDGNFVTNNGTFSTLVGDFVTADGDITSTRGNLTLTSGYALLSDGNLTLANGDLSVTGDSVFTGDLTVGTGDILTGAGTDIIMNTNQMILTSAGTLDMAGKFISSYTGAQASEFQGKLYVGGVLTAAGGMDLLGTLDISENLDVTGTLTVDGITTLNSDVDASGQTITATLFDGVATSAQYADLAEKYEADDIYAPGTVVSIGVDTEITLYDPNLPLAGVISTNPGYLLNKNDETEGYLEVALKGRVPVFTDMFITRGQYIFPDAYNRGKCIGVYKQDLVNFDMVDLIGVAVNTSMNGMVEVKV